MLLARCISSSPIEYAEIESWLRIEPDVHSWHMPSIATVVARPYVYKLLPLSLPLHDHDRDLYRLRPWRS